MTNRLANRSRHTAVHFAVAAALLAATQTQAQDNAAADPAPGVAEATDTPEITVTLDHYAFIPAWPEYESIEDPYDLPADPTIIPFSNWQFRGPDGDWQPWQKRALRYRTDSGGQDNRAADQPRLALLWTTPSDEEVTWASFDLINTNRDFSWSSRTSSGRLRGAVHQHYKSLDLNDIASLPNELRYQMFFTQGDWQTVATFDFESEFPLGNEHVTVQYLGSPRPDGPTVEVMNAHNDLDPGEYEIELHTTRNYSHDEWRYRVDLYADDGDLSYHGSQTTSEGPDRYRLLAAAPEAFHHAELRRRQVFSTELDPIDLRLLDNLEPEERIARRIELTDAHRFGEPTQFRLDPLTPGAKCLVDLDFVRVVTLPEDKLDDAALARFFDDEEVDLMYGPFDEDNAYALRMVASPVYELSATFWEQTPAECVANVREADRRPRYGILPAPGDTAWLTTTSDGTMLLIRVIAVEPADVGVLGPVTLEVRRLEGP